MEWFFFVFIPVLVALFSDDDKKTVKRSRAMKRGKVAKLESSEGEVVKSAGTSSGRLSAAEAAPSGQKVVKVVLSEDKDADIIEFLKHCENKGEFFRFAAREFIEREEE
jgi:hypothetical protein